MVSIVKLLYRREIGKRVHLTKKQITGLYVNEYKYMDIGVKMERMSVDFVEKHG